MTSTRDAEPTVSGILLRWLGRILLGALVALAVIFVGDYLVFVGRGKPLDQVMVNRYMAAPLKGDKTALYFESSGPLACSRSLFPQAGWSACWRLRKHPNIAEAP